MKAWNILGGIGRGLMEGSRFIEQIRSDKARRMLEQNRFDLDKARFEFEQQQAQSRMQNDMAALRPHHAAAPAEAEDRLQLVPLEQNTASAPNNDAAPLPASYFAAGQSGAGRGEPAFSFMASELPGYARGARVKGWRARLQERKKHLSPQK